MSRYIDADKLAREYERHPTRWYFGRDVLREIGEAETVEVDAEPVRNGRWMTCEDGWGDDHYQCSECGEEWTLIDGTPEENGMRYCPNCGAKMDGDGDGQTD